MYRPDLAPLGGSLALSSLCAALPLLTVFICLGALRWRAHWAGLAGLAVALLLAVLGYGMPMHLAALSASEGFVYGLFPIIWIVVSAIWFYELTVRSGRFDDLRRAINRISDDPRIQAIIIAFCFGGMLEALAGFGAPVAITAVMLLSIGFAPMRAAIVALLANTAPVAFGALAIPIITAGDLTGIDYHHIGAVVGHQAPLIAVFVPAFLVLLVDGLRGLRQVWPAVVVVGVVFAVAQWISATYVSVEMTDIIASLCGLAAVVVVLRIWTPPGGDSARARLCFAATAATAGGEDGMAAEESSAALEAEAADGADARPLTSARTVLALFPYIVVVVIFALAKMVPVIALSLAATDIAVPWPGLHDDLLNAAGKPAASATFKLTWLSSPGTLLLISGAIVAIVYRMQPAAVARTYFDTVLRMRWSILTIAAVLSLAYVMNQSGQTLTIGAAIAATGPAFAFLAPILGWLGTAVTGSDTSANALFATLQQSAAQRAGIDPALLVAANTTGGVVGKMISPQNLAIAATAVGLVGRESEILRKVLPWSLGLLVALCVIVGLQSTPVLSWLLP